MVPSNVKKRNAMSNEDFDNLIKNIGERRPIKLGDFDLDIDLE